PQPRPQPSASTKPRALQSAGNIGPSPTPWRSLPCGASAGPTTGHRRGAHPFSPGHPATATNAGRDVTFTEYAFYHFRDGRFEHMWYLLDAQTASLVSMVLCPLGAGPGRASREENRMRLNNGLKFLATTALVVGSATVD